LRQTTGVCLWSKSLSAAELFATAANLSTAQYLAKYREVQTVIPKYMSNEKPPADAGFDPRRKTMRRQSLSRLKVARQHHLRH